MNNTDPEDELPGSDASTELVLEGELLGPDDGPEPLQFGRGTRKLADAVWAYELRVKGMSCRSIALLARSMEPAVAANVTERRVSRLMDWYLDKHVAPTAERIRKMSTDRLESYLLRLERGIEVGSPVAIQTAIRIDENIRRIWAADTPTTAGEAAGAASETTAELKGMLEGARARLEAAKHAPDDTGGESVANRVA